MTDTNGLDERPRKRLRRSPSPLPAPDATRIASYTLLPPQSYASSSPTPFQKPTPLTSFSYSPTRELLLSPHGRDSAKATYHPPHLGADLNLGFQDCTWRDGLVDEGLDALLDTLLEWEKRDTTGAAADTLAKVGLVTWRGMVSKLMLAVYETENARDGRGRADGWEMNAMLVNGVLYLEDSLPPAKLEKKQASEQSYALQSYYGYSFEAHSTGPFSPPNTNVQWCSVVKTSLGSSRIILGGEVDCVMPGSENSRGTDGFVELKTNIMIQNQRDEVMFERQKLLKHYVQSFLLGVPNITVGFRTRPGILSGLQTFRTLEIPRLVRQKPHGWDPLLCLASADQLLQVIKQAIHSHNASHSPSDKSSYPVFRISFDPLEGKLSLRPLSPTEVKEEVMKGKKQEERCGFLLKRWVDKSKTPSLERSSSTPAPPPSVTASPIPVLPPQPKLPAYIPPSVAGIKR